MRTYPALEITWPRLSAAPSDERIDLLLATMDDESPIALERCGIGVRVFFGTPAARDRAAATLAAADPDAASSSVDVPDEDWAARSQASLGPVTIGRITVAPPDRDVPAAADIVVRIRASMGFGTGHHASTRLVLRLLQRVPVAGTSVLDVGTGSGVLAVAARALGAADVVALDVDPDALASARDNLSLNGVTGGVVLLEQDLAAAPAALGRTFDVVLANLTGAMLSRYADELARLAGARGRLICSGFQEEDRKSVV